MIYYAHTIDMICSQKVTLIPKVRYDMGVQPAFMQTRITSKHSMALVKVKQRAIHCTVVRAAQNGHQNWTYLTQTAYTTE